MENFADIEARAKAGDAAAQYRLAALLDGAGRAEEARAWTARAADSGHPGALYTRACQMLSVPPSAMDVRGAVAALARAAGSGGAAAMRQLGVLKALGFDGPKDWAGAVDLVASAARAGHPAALRELAVAAESVSGEAGAGGALLGAAARKGDRIAQILAIRRGDVLHADEAAPMLARLRAAGAPLTAGVSVQQFQRAPAANPDIAAIAALAKGDVSARPLARQAMRDAPQLYAIESLLSDDECAYVICASAPLLTPSLVVDPQQGRADQAQYRTSDGALFGLVDLDLALTAIYARLARAVELPNENCELIGVLRYRPGQEYRPHYDFLPEDANDYSEVRRCGQRARTLLVYLNDDYAGGETIFPNLALAHRGKAGDGFVFRNLDASGAPDRDTLHAGAPVTQGEKWLLSLWCRERRFWFWD